MAQRMVALVFRTTVLIDDAGRDLRRMEPAVNDAVAMLDIAALVHEYEVACIIGAGKAMLAQGGFVQTGTPEDIVRAKQSYTGSFLKDVLKRGRQKTQAAE